MQSGHAVSIAKPARRRCYRGSPTSSRSAVCCLIAASPKSIATHSAGTFIRDVLLTFDLPEVAASVADRELTLLSPVDAMKHAARSSEMHETYA
jgi:hypothetical protein